jgi:hypothetical protein
MRYVKDESKNVCSKLLCFLGVGCAGGRDRDFTPSKCQHLRNSLLSHISSLPLYPIHIWKCPFSGRCNNTRARRQARLYRLVSVRVDDDKYRDGNVGCCWREGLARPIKDQRSAAKAAGENDEVRPRRRRCRSMESFGPGLVILVLLSFERRI